MTGVTMSRKEFDRVEVFAQLKAGTVSKSEVTVQLGVSLRQVKRLWKVYRTDGPAGLAHGLRGRVSNRRLDGDLVARAVELVRTNYADFGPTFAAEKLTELHGLKLGVETLRGALMTAGIWTPHQRHRPVAHSWRERRALRGELVQADGSPHRWFEDRGEPCTLLQFIDDATSELVWLEFAESESTHALMTATKHYLEVEGRPLALYTDRGGVFKVNLGNENNERITQYERALTELGITLIHARSPQAKGRVERGFQTHQDRLVKELRLADISTIEAANEFVRDQYLPAHNRKFAVTARQAGDAHRSIQDYVLDEILCVKESRTVGNDLTVRYMARWFQLAPTQRTIVRPKQLVTVQEHLDGQISLVHGRTSLTFTELPNRPARQLVARPSVPRQPWIPPVNHPWRRPFGAVILQPMNQAG